MATSSSQLEFITKELPIKVLEQNRDYENFDFVNCLIKTSDHLDGFMSTIYQADIQMKNKSDDKINTLQTIIKVMKSDLNFRAKSQSDEQFVNEIFIYTKVIPYFCDILNTSSSKVKGEEWGPKVYYGEYGIFENYSPVRETILVLENLKPGGYISGPRLDLDEDHIRLMLKKIAPFHACTYAMRILKDPKLEEFMKAIFPLNFLKPDGSPSLYNILYEIALEKLFKYTDKHTENMDDQLKIDLDNLKRMYGAEPMKLMQRFLERDNFSVILHGDYNRNNVLFKYEGEKVVDVKMIDFQETRYGTPAIDLAFFLYMNMTPELRNQVWDELLKYYHEQLIEAMTDILNCDKMDARLEPWNYENFLNHFSKFALYGGMVAVHFTPWMGCSEEECGKMSALFDEDMYSSEFKSLALAAGGEAMDERITDVMRHCSKMGYMKIIE